MFFAADGYDFGKGPTNEPLPFDTIGDTPSSYAVCPVAGKAFQFAIGEILNGEYRVRAIEEDKDGTILHRCSRLFGDEEEEEVLVHIVGKKELLTAAGEGHPNRTEQVSIGVPLIDFQQGAERFEVQSGGHTLICVVQRQTERASANKELDFEGLRTHEQPQQRPAPHGSRILVFKRDDCHLEVDIPANGFSGEGAALLVFIIFWFGGLCGMITAIVYFSSSVHAAFCLLLLLFQIPFWIAGWFLVRYALWATYLHENLTITPTGFYIRRMLEFVPQHRDSVNNAHKAAEELTPLDIMFCPQVAGYSRNLRRARVKEHTTSEGKKTEYFVLEEGVKEHRLCSPLADAERDWLISEINETLASISQGNHAPFSHRSPPFVPQIGDV